MISVNGASGRVDHVNVAFGQFGKDKEIAMSGKIS